ncbi:PE-PPE domain-containing protein [Corynebacterium lipophiloflavum]|uniref:PE-PPE domain-containing protein n=1 Tax=Corynebacterium lipophiloflavum (strain ATCC 700352 / DSM 44291 / CCUG 37336 / JCM 10383 / DMMZ 1944) TaxID=525263 RepID=C0XRI9_CORLD|nr:PE-PPE domain-containing protein [Corynebacterium lipophiloflavum]EEI17121.1 hypothetical protein HMPREF0298_1059 [Corynebacterium lipophiloflavum DSM 44291]
MSRTPAFTLRAVAVALAVALTAALAAILVPAAGLAGVHAPHASAQQRCPAVAVIAARGSGQNTQVIPTTYSPGAAWTSNGWEGETIRAFLRHAEGRYRATHGGASLMNDVEVIGLEPRYYPAVYPAYDTPAVVVPATIAQAVGLAVQYTVPALQMARAAGTQFLDSVNAGRSGVMQAINDYEASSGCRPGYILIGFSQGAMVLLEHEKELAARGQLAGVVYLGNPNTAPGDWSTVGVGGGGAGGVLGALPFNSKSAAATSNRVTYCLPLDGICDLSIATLRGAEGNGGNHGRYYLQPSPWDDQVSDSLGRFVDQVRYR